MQAALWVRSKKARAGSQSRELIWIKRGIWIYFWLLIFEGALRKWIVPELSAPLLLVRDPILLFIYWMALRPGRATPPKLGLFSIFALPIVILTCAQVAFGTNTILIALYGLRSYLLHLPLVLIIAEVFTFEDVKKIGRSILILSVPMALLMLAQYRASPSSWLNAGAGEGASQSAVSGEHVRVAGTFSFGTGIVCFFPLVLAFLLYALSRPKTYAKWILGPAVLSTIIAIPLACSRTLLFVAVSVAGFALAAGFRTPRTLSKLVQVALAFGIVSIAALRIPVVEESMQTFQDRWQQASGKEGDVADVLSLRVLGVITDGFDSAQSAPWLGEGIGMGSNVAAYLQTGSQQFMLAEMEWPRVVLEFGPILGLGFMLFRILICCDLLNSALCALKRNSSLSWLLLPATLPFLIINPMEQPTNLGFMVLSAGLCFAAAKNRSGQPNVQLAMPQERVPVRRRGWQFASSPVKGLVTEH